MKNCINCGSPIKYNEVKCPYCGTSYYDFTSINFDGMHPVALKLKMPNGMLLESLVIPKVGDITMQCHENVVRNSFGELCVRSVTDTSSIDIRFDMMHNPLTGELFRVIKEVE